MIFLRIVFRNKRLEGNHHLSGNLRTDADTPLECLTEIGQINADATHTDNNEDNKYRQIFRLREVHFLAAFICLYVGAEVTVGGSWLCFLLVQI